MWNKRSTEEQKIKEIGILSRRLFVGSAWIPWITGKENFPSVKSSAKPFFNVYLHRCVDGKPQLNIGIKTHFFALQIHVIVTNLVVQSD